MFSLSAWHQMYSDIQIREKTPFTRSLSCCYCHTQPQSHVPHHTAPPLGDNSPFAPPWIHTYPLSLVYHLLILFPGCKWSQRTARNKGKSSPPLSWIPFTFQEQVCSHVHYCTPLPISGMTLRKLEDKCMCQCWVESTSELSQSFGCSEQEQSTSIPQLHGTQDEPFYSLDKNQIFFFCVGNSNGYFKTYLHQMGHWENQLARTVLTFDTNSTREQVVAKEHSSKDAHWGFLDLWRVEWFEELLMGLHSSQIQPV